MNFRQRPNSLRQQRHLKEDAVSDNEVYDFLVVGELKNDSRQLLVVGDDGRFYAYNVLTGEIDQQIPDDAWSVDMSFPDTPRTTTAIKRPGL